MTKRRCTVLTTGGETFSGTDLKRSHTVEVAGKPITIYQVRTEDERAHQRGTRFVMAHEIRDRY